MLDFQLLENLCMANGISGDEGDIRNIIISQIRDYANKIAVDNLGNLLVFKSGRMRAKKKLLVSAHMDEVGLMVIDITSDGYIKFDEVGGIDRRVLLGKKVKLGRKGINGVIGIKPVHLSKGDEALAIPAYSDMYIDIGAQSREEALKYVSLGDSISFSPDFKINGEAVQSKAIDDRFGCAVLIDMIKSNLEYDTYFSFVVQEEVGLRGAKTAAFGINPDFAIVVETTTAADIPEVDTHKQVCKLGEGAVISVMDRRTIYDKQMVKKAFECAENLSIKTQYKKAVAGGNDAGAIHLSRSGVRTLAVSLPCRYLHAPNCTANISDCKSVASIVAELSKCAAGGEICGEEIL